jgi:hypothetical protein
MNQFQEHLEYKFDIPSYFFMSGALMIACFVIAIFFLRFWDKTKDRIFGFFSVSFALLGVERIILAYFVHPTESQPMIYLIRLLAFCLIAIAIIDKNRAQEDK